MKEYKYISLAEVVEQHKKLEYYKNKNKIIMGEINKKNRWKAIVFLCVALVFLVVSVMAFHWEDTAKKPFWYTMWPYFGVLSIFCFIGMIWWFGKSQNKW